MILVHHTRSYEYWAPVVGRILIATGFLVGAAFKLPGGPMFAMQVESTAAVGVPLASVAVILAFILEVVAGLAIVVGWHTRLAAFLLMLYTILLTLLFHMNFADPMAFGLFATHLYLIGGLLCLSVYGAHHAVIQRSRLPYDLARK